MESKPYVVLITGANTGIGFATAQALWASSKAYHIILSGRTPSKVKDAVSSIQSASAGNKDSIVEGMELDVTSDEAIAAAVTKVTEGIGRVDALVNNAGASFDVLAAQGKMTARESLNRAYDLNVASAFLMTDAFIPLLIRSTDPRLVFVTSGMASLEEELSRTTPAENRRAVAPPGWPKPATVDGKNCYAANGSIGYRSSKAALNMVFLHWVRTLTSDGVKCFNVSPGFLATSLSGTPEAAKKAGAGDSSLGGTLIKEAIEGKRDGDVNHVIRSDSVQPW